MKPNGLNTWLGNLKETMHFESTATQVFERLIHGQGPGLLVLYGPSVKANKTYFLKTVEAFQNGSSGAKKFVSAELWRLLVQLEVGSYQCVSVQEDFPVPPNSNIYRTPLSIVVPMALAEAAQKRGLHSGRNIVIMCDDLHEFMAHNKQMNEQFLVELARFLDNQSKITFLGASRLKHAWPNWDVQAVLPWGHVLPLGWD